MISNNEQNAAWGQHVLLHKDKGQFLRHFFHLLHLQTYHYEKNTGILFDNLQWVNNYSLHPLDNQNHFVKATLRY